MVKYLEKMVSVRIVSVEYYMCCPVPDLDIIYSEFRNIEVRQVPVIQIFGSTESGEKACLNIHGVLPYLYIPYDGLEASGPLSYKIALELDKHINISLGQATSNTIHVHNVVLVSGTPMYGYHEKPHQFFKIYLYNPAIVKKACSLLENGTILGKCFQPHEVHINYILQFKIDYNLHGMSFINVSHVKYRHNPDYPEYLSDISADLILPKSLIPRTVSKLEMDALVSDITNAEQVRNGIGVNPGIAAIWNDERQRRREQNLDSQISFSLTQERVNKPIPTLSDRLYNKRLQDKLTQDSVVSDDKSILNNSVYPAETPDDIDICAASNTSVFDVTFLDETLTTECLDVFDQKDQNLLDILQELKEAAHVEEDSILSQQTPAPIDVTEFSSDEEVEDLSNSLDQNIVKAIDDVVVNNNFDPWADSFWDDNVSVPQLDGIHDTDIGDSQSESTTNSQKSNSPRYANEAYVCNSQIKIPSTMCLSVGSNTLILNKPKNDSTMSAKINILSDIPVRTKKRFYITLNIDDIDQEPPAIENYTPLCIDDGDYRSLKNQEDLNNVLVHDVNMGISLLDESCQLKDNSGSSKMSYYSTREEDEVLDYEYSSGNETFNEKENINENITKHFCSKKYELQLFDTSDKKSKQGTHNCGNASNHRTVRKLNTSKNHRSQSEDSHFNNNNSCEFNDSYISSRLSDTNINLTIRNLSAKIKNRLCNRNLDGADDTPTSGSNSSTEDNKSCEEKQQKKRVKHSPSPSRKKPSKNGNKSKCRISGLVKLSAKGTKNKSKQKHVAPSEKAAIVKEPFLPFDEDSLESIFPSVKSVIISQTVCKIPEEEILQIIEPTISSEGNVKKTRQKSEKAAPLKKEVTIGPENAKKRKRSARKVTSNISKEDTTNITLDNPSASGNKDQIVPSIKIVRKSRSEKIKTQSDSYLHDEDIETSSLSDYVILQNTDNIVNDSVSKINLHIVPAPAKKSIRPKKRSKKIERNSSVLEVVKINPEISTNYSDVKSTEINCTSENPARTFKKLVKKTKKVSNQSKKESSPLKIFPDVSASSAENSVVENKDLVLKKSVKNFSRIKKESKAGTCKIAPLKACQEVSASSSNYSVTENKINDFQEPVIKNYEDKNLPIPEITAATTSTITNPTDRESNLEASSKDTFYSVNQELVTKSDRPNKVIIVSEIIPSNATIEKSSVGVPATNSEVSSKEKNQNLQQFVKKSRPSPGVKVKTSPVNISASNSATSVQIKGTQKLQEFVKKSDQSAIILSEITVPTSSADSILEAREAISNVPVKENNSQVFKKFGRPKKNNSLFSNISVERSSVDSILEAPVVNSDDTAKANLQRSVKKYGRPKKSAVIIETLPEKSNSEVSEKKSLFLKQPVIKLTRCQKKPIAEITSNSENSTEANASQIIDDLHVNKYASEKTEIAVEICSKYANTKIPQFSNNSEDSKIENVTQILQSPIRKRGRSKKLLIPTEAEFSGRQKKPIAEITSNSENSTEGNATQIIDDVPVNKYASEKTEICSKYANTKIPQFSNNSEDSKIENVTQMQQSPVRKRGRAKKLLIPSEAEFSGRQKKSIAEIISNFESSTEENATQIIDDLPVNRYASEKTEVAVEICSKFVNTEIPQFSNNSEDSKIENVTQILQSPIRKRGRSKKLLIPSEAEFSGRQKKPIAEIISNSDNSTEANATQIIDNLPVNKYASEKTEIAVEICSKYANTKIPQFSNNSEDSKIENVTQMQQSPVRKRGRAKKLLIPSEAEFRGRQKKPIAEIISSSDNSIEANATQIIDDLPVNKYASKKTEVALEICSKYANTKIPQFSNNSEDSKIENVTQILQSPIRKRGRSKKLPIPSEAEFSENVGKQIPTNLDSEFAVGSNPKDGEIEQKVQIFHSPVRKRGRSKKSSVESEPKSNHCETAIIVKDISLAEVDDNVILSTFDDMSQINKLNKPVRRRGKPKKSSKQPEQSNSVNVRIKSPPVDDKAITAYNLPENVVDASFEDTTHLVKKLSRSKKPSIPIEPSLLEVKDKIDLPIKPEIADYLNKLNMTETNALEQLQNINVKIEDSSLAIDKLNNASKVHIAKKLFEEIKVNNSDMKSNKYADFKKMPTDTGISKKASSKRFRKRISLQLKKPEGTENLENTISPVLKDLRVNLTRVDDLVDKHHKLKELRVVLERLNMEKILAEKLKTTASANVEQPSAKVKKSKSNRIQTASSIEQSFDSYEDITEPPIDQKKKLLGSPKRNAGKKNKSALKYSPLPVVIRSPTKQVTVQSPKKTIAVNSPKKRIILEKPRAKLSSRNSVLTTVNLKKEDSATETKVPGIGEFLALSLEKRHTSEETEDHAGTLNQAIKDKPLNNCDTRNQKNTLISSTNAASIKVTHDKTLAINSIKKNLFSEKKTQCNDDFVERDSTTWKQSEESFLDEIDVAAGMSKDKSKDYLFFANKYNSEGNNWTSPPKIDFNTVDNINFKYSNRTSARKAPISKSTNTENVIFKTPEKKSIITSADYLDYSPFGSSYDTPQKQTQSNELVFTPRETLSQKCEKELYDKNYYFTKTDNLTVAERYDLERNFAPQPGCSNVPDLVINTQQDGLVHTNHTQTSTESFRNAFDFSQYVASQNLSILDESIIQSDSKSRIWMPKFNPPTVRDIKNTMEDYNIPKYRFQFPFYSDYRDVTKKVDVGSNVLKIPSKSVSELEEFCSSVNYEGLEQWRKAKFQNACPDAEISNKSNLRVTLSSNSEFIMTPVKPPPSKKYVMKWLETKNDINQQESSVKAQKMKIRIPRSPGHDNYSGDDSIIVSPCTPDIAKPSPASQTTESNTASSLISSQTFIHKKVRRKGLMQRKKLFHYSQPKSKKTSCNSNNSCEVTGISLDNTHGFKLSYENLQHAKAITEHQYLTVLVMEMHIRTRGELYPDPQYDAIRAIFYSITNDVPENSTLPNKETGILLINSLPISPTKDFKPLLEGSGIKCEVYLNSELDLIDSLIKLIKKWDPDIVTGFEIEMQSWGYFIERCYVLGIDVLSQISRTNPALLKNKTINFEPSKEIKLHGRIVLDAWRLFRSEIALTSYTFENLMYHILHKRKPTHSFKDLSFWWDHKSNYYRHITAKYYIDRVEGIIELMDQLDLIGRTSELARLFGIQFYEVLSRGSQFRVESMMLRLAKPMNYIPVSPSVQQRAKMRAPEWTPLIFEPQSRFYADPVIVLDFQSLYPSIIIAYNYCYSTCVGRVEKLGTDQVFEFGACQLRLPKHKLKNIKDHLTFSPCGVGFVTAKVRQGILPRMLKEILETRLMVKASMKGNKENKILQRVLHSRQLGLKLIANVTYGYTAANFSGRMPCSEVGDSVVSKGRETLERAIKMIENTPKWRAKVVYGDTDSVFVLLEGRSREEAFKIGEEIAESVTNDNPPPVKLKLEKIYQPCILQTKKRYVGYMYESIDQRDPEYNAKGIETVRRDGCPAVAKMLEKSLRTLFETKDVSLVKRYVMRQFEKLISGRVSIQDLTFAREYRGAGGYRPGACVPALELARKWTAVDKRREPRRGERVPYIIVHGPPGVPLIKLARCPKELLGTDPSSQGLRPNAEYYITRVIIPALNRCFALIGANMHAWYNDMPRKQISTLPTDVHFEKSKKSTISQYFATMNCAVCGIQTTHGLCEKCCQNSQKTLVTLNEKIWRWERNFTDVNKICESCCGRGEQIQCISLDCPVLYRLLQTSRDLKQVPFLRTLIDKF